MKRWPKWQKLGLLYSPCGKQHKKLCSHAANPLPLHIKDDVFRIFYSARDENNRSSVGGVDIDIVQRCVVKTYEEPFFTHGAPSSFYADGVSIGNSYNVNGEKFILFMGWQAPKGKHWRGDIGKLRVTSALQLELASETPVMSADDEDPISFSYPWVHRNQDDSFDMWYGSTITWNADNDEMIHVIKHASSENGHDWSKTGLSVPYQLNIAQAFSRPTVIKYGDNQHDMWFSYRSGSGESYRIGYAYNDGKGWQLAVNESGITVSSSGWDSEMIAYPFVFKHKDKTYMLYNGNGYGKSGFGLAQLSYQKKP